MRAPSNRIIIQLETPTTETKGGVILPVSATKTLNKQGKVISVGQNVKHVSEGDRVRLQIGSDLNNYIQDDIVSVMIHDIELVL